MSYQPQYWPTQTSEYVQPAQTTAYASPTQYGQYSGAHAPTASTVDYNPSDLRGNNKWGSAGTWKCRVCRDRHKKCVIIPGSQTCVHCDKMKKPCVLEFAPKSGPAAMYPDKSVDGLSGSPQECDFNLSDIARQAEAQYPSYEIADILRMVADSLGYTLVPKTSTTSTQLQELQLPQTATATVSPYATTMYPSMTGYPATIGSQPLGGVPLATSATPYPLATGDYYTN